MTKGEYRTYTIDQLVSLYDWMADETASGTDYYDSMVEVSEEIRRRQGHKSIPYNSVGYAMIMAALR